MRLNFKYLPYQAKSAHAHGLQVRVSEGILSAGFGGVDRWVCVRSAMAFSAPTASCVIVTDLLVISNVVPKICARTNSAILS